ncbi:MAG: BON domain-containing protein [Thermoanaerobaculia bacterium]|nr:MAG: BON domain-containing protein [Thermoanaerobaculia bacterium]
MRCALRAFALLFTVTVLVAGAACAQDESPDWSTTLRVRLSLLHKLGADGLRVEVITSDGRVQLAGTVEKRETRELAAEVARGVEGVREVRNDVRLEAPKAGPGKVEGAAREAEAEVRDAVLESKAHLALIDKFGRDGFRVGVEAASGVVTLEVPEGIPAERRRQMVGLVEDVEGVEKVITVEKR